MRSHCRVLKRINLVGFSFLMNALAAVLRIEFRGLKIGTGKPVRR